jgi:hypothetical protein
VLKTNSSRSKNQGKKKSQPEGLTFKLFNDSVEIYKLLLELAGRILYLWMFESAIYGCLTLLLIYIDSAVNLY